MTKSEHRVRVDNGKYEFIRREDGSVNVLRHGEPWLQRCMPQNGIASMMAELDAARLVVQAFRDLVAPGNDRLSTREGFNRITDALALHDRLTSDREPPSAWCGAGAMASGSDCNCAGGDAGGHDPDCERRER